MLRRHKDPRSNARRYGLNKKSQLPYFREQALKEPIPVQLYIQNGILARGLRDKILLNAEPFDSNGSMSSRHFRRIAKERFGSAGLQLRRRVSSKRRRHWEINDDR